MVIACFSTVPGIHIGTGVSFPSGAELCMEGPVDAARYTTGTKLFCAVTYPSGVSGPNIKTYFNGELKKTYCGDPDRSGQFVWWESGGWTGGVRFDFCDGADVLCSRSTLWTSDAVIPVPEVIPEVTPVPEVIPEVPPVPEVVPEVTPVPEVEPVPVVLPVPEVEPKVKEACYIKFDIPLLDLLPGIPCEWWGELPLLPGFKKTTEP